MVTGEMKGSEDTREDGYLIREMAHIAPVHTREERYPLSYIASPQWHLSCSALKLKYTG